MILAELSLQLFVAKEEIDADSWIIKYFVDANEEYLIGIDNLKIGPSLFVSQVLTAHFPYKSFAAPKLLVQLILELIK